MMFVLFYPFKKSNVYQKDVLIDSIVIYIFYFFGVVEEKMEGKKEGSASLK